MKTHYELQLYKANANIGQTEDSVIAREIIDQNVDINQLAKDIAAATPAIDETIATMVLMNLPKVILKHALESHNVQIGNPMTNEVALSIHPNINLDWQVTDPTTGKQKSVAFSLSNVRKYLKKDYATLQDALVEITPSMIRTTLAADLSTRYIQQFKQSVHIERQVTAKSILAPADQQPSVTPPKVDDDEEKME